ncbi:PucR family transcriptional regulator [Neobacillus sp. SM06]|uniref:PucR family transcriptional regulator n=1 Tax=Neobacillus sp. SM06 TaxID=3422492 RepID=UPI003D2AABB3
MLSKLQRLYSDAVLFTTQPHESLEGFCLFADYTRNEWLAIPKTNLSEPEIQLLQTLYELVDQGKSTPISPMAKSWYDYLFLNGLVPSHAEDVFFRFIQFQMKGDLAEPAGIEQALKGFFPDDIIVLWENSHSGVIVEKQKIKTSFLSEKELHFMTETLESDFYVKIYFYIGKPLVLSNTAPGSFQAEKEYFHFGQAHLGQIRVFSFERIFPSFLAAHLPEPIQEKLQQTISEAFADDPEMLRTIKVFLETNLNASLTAKKLYIHRNTLQYRIDKFTDKTGIQLKDFYGAFAVFLACVLYEEEDI